MKKNTEYVPGPWKVLEHVLRSSYELLEEKNALLDALISITDLADIMYHHDWEIKAAYTRDGSHVYRRQAELAEQLISKARATIEKATK